MAEHHLTLSLGARIRLAAYRKTASNLETVLRDVERGLTGGSPRVRWKTGQDTPVLAAVASANGVDDSTIAQIVSTTRLAFERVVRSDGNAVDYPSALSDEGKTALANIMRRLDQAKSLIIESDGAPPLLIEQVTLRQQFGKRGFPSERTSVDGVIDLISVRGRLLFTIDEHGTGRRLPCHVGEKFLAKAKEALARRAVVEGLLIYDRNGVPTQIRDVTDIWIRPAGRDVRELVGSLPQFSGKLSGGEYVRRMRRGNAR